MFVSKDVAPLFIIAVALAGSSCANETETETENEPETTSPPLFPDTHSVSGMVPGMPGVVTTATELSDSPSGATCRGYYFPVTERDGAPSRRMFAEVCTRVPLRDSVPVQVLLHGGTYDHAYWDWPFKPEIYSYVEHATLEGYITVNVDRLGYGKSERLNPETLDFDVGSRATHQLVAYLRGGALGPRFSTIILNGHSMGGIVAEREAARYDDVDAVLVSGLANEPPGSDDDDDDGSPGEGEGTDDGPPDSDGNHEGPPDNDEDGEGGGPPGGAFYPFYPAEEDPKFADQELPAGYLTTLPGERAKIFLHEGSFDPEIIEFEEALKDTLTIAELRTVRPGDEDEDDRSDEAEEDGSAPAGPRTPTVHILGRYDAIACNPTRDCTRDLVDPTRYIIVEDSGHSINMCTGAPAFYQVTFDWLRKRGLAPAKP